MPHPTHFWGALSRRHGVIGLLLLALGEALILIRVRPLSDFYFPFTWLGYILFLDAATYAHGGRSLFHNRRRLWLAMFPVSSVFWWLFEWLNLAVHNWVYVGGSNYPGFTFALIASIDFSTVLPAVFTTALFMSDLIGKQESGERDAEVPRWLLVSMLLGGVVCVALPIVFPKFAFGLIWCCMYLLLDPINYRAGRPTIVSAAWNRRFYLPLSFGLGTLVCGFFWEAWNFWSMPKWQYDIPYVGFWHVFEMPLLGWTGYLPFGLELFAMANFLFSLLRLGSLSVFEDEPPVRRTSAEERAS